MILSIDTFSEVLGICLLDDNLDLKFKTEYRQLVPFSELIIDEIDRQFKRFGIDKRSISKIIVNKGPGSYTGLRIGITTAKTLSYALEVPVFSYSSLDAMYFPFRHMDKKVLCVVNAGKGEVYLKSFNDSTYERISIEKRESLFNIIEKYEVIVEKNIGLEKSIKVYGSLALEGTYVAIEKNTEEDIFKLEPIYLRKS